ncbi:MAG TPA: hypothetical protein VMA13_09935, partial [Candidatus Saccharimonadales bacterium]|nr:hypothetical protein [Candidatus Saccharimonadales bacterium]
MKNITFVGRWCGGIRFASLLGGSVVTLLSVGHVLATPPPMISAPSEISTNGMATSANFFEGISRRSYLLGDMWGLRPWLSQYGLSLNILETSEVLG